MKRTLSFRSAKLCPSLLETDRVLSRPEGESAFHIFYYLWEGVEGVERERLALNDIDEPAPLMKRLRQDDDRERAKTVRFNESFCCISVS